MSGSIRDVRVAVWNPSYTTCYAGDISRTDLSGGHVAYEMTPGGCGAGEIGLGLYYEDVFARGYWTEFNIVEISTGDDALQAAITAGATKIYVKSRKPYDPAYGEDTQQIFINDGVHLTLGIPVTGVGTDGGGDYLTIGSPNTAIPGNPGTVPAYGIGAVVGRRRYAGVIRMRERPFEKIPAGTITLGPLSAALDEAVDGYTIGAAANVDVSAAVSSFCNFGSSQWPHLIYNGSNFATNTGVVFSGQRTDATIAQMVSDGILAINTGDLFVMRVGHDRVLRWVRYYTSATNTYAYNLTFNSGTTTFEPLSIDITDQDCSSFYNRIKVNGTTNPATQQPYSAIVSDTTSISLIGRIIDGAPVTNSALNSDLACANAARALLNQNSLGKSRGGFRVYGRYDTTPDFMPMGLPIGDGVRGFENVTIARLDATGTSRNRVPDSPMALAGTKWTSGGSGGSVSCVAAGLTNPDGSAALGFLFTGTGGVSTLYEQSAVIDVVPGETFTLSGWINALGVTAGSIGWRVNDPLNNQIDLLTVAPGAGGARVSKTVTIPKTATYTQVTVLAAMQGATLSNGGNAYLSQPMIGPASAAYEVNRSAPDVYGLVSSAKSVIDFATLESYQDVLFNPVEPDWIAAVAEHSNALSSALHNNTGTSVTLAGYIVSAAAFPPSYSTASRVLSTPAFLAQFGLGGATISVPAQSSLTLPANATSWIYLSSGGTWSTQTQPIPTAGSIMYGYATTNASGIVGFTQLAAIGVVIVGTASGSPMPAVIKAAGPSYNGASCTLGTQVSGAASASQPLSVSFADWTGAPPDWLDFATYAIRNHASGALIGDPVPFTVASNVVALTAQLPAGVAAVDIGFSYTDHANQTTAPPYTWPSQFSNIAVGGMNPSSNLGMGKTNFVADSDFAYGLSYWKNVGSPALVVRTIAAGEVIASSPGANTNQTGALYSQPFTPVANQAYCPSAGMGWTDVGGGGTMFIGIVNASDYNAGNVTPASIIASYAVPVSAGTYISQQTTPFTYTFGASPPASVCFCWWWVSANYSFSMFNPQIEPGTIFTGYVAGAATTSVSDGGAAKAAAAQYGNGNTVEYLRPAEPLAEVTTGKPVSLLKDSGGANILGTRFSGGKPWVNPADAIHVDGTQAITQKHIVGDAAFRQVAISGGGANLVENPYFATAPAATETGGYIASRWKLEYSIGTWSPSQEAAGNFSFAAPDLLVRLPSSVTIPASTSWDYVPAQNYASPFPVKPGEQLAMNVSLRIDSNASFPAGVSGFILGFIRWYKADGTTYVGDTQFASCTGAESTVPTVVTAPALSGVAVVRFLCRVSNSNGTGFSTGANLYFDGRLTGVSVKRITNYDNEIQEGTTYARTPQGNFDNLTNRNLLAAKTLYGVGGPTVDSLRPQEVGANVTETRNANGLAYSGTVISAQAFTGSFDGSQLVAVSAKNSTIYNASVPNLLNISSDFAFVFAFGGAGTTSCTWYICGRDSSGNPVSGQAVTFTRPDTSTFSGITSTNTVIANGVATSAGTSGSPNTFNTATTGQTVYAIIYYVRSGLVGASRWYVTLQTTVPTPAQVNAASSDGITVLISSYSGPAQVGVSGGGTSGNQHGGKGFTF